MKKNIHPEYHKNIEAKCACGASFKTGSTQEELHTEICFMCHPLYTGTQKLVDTAGRVDRFKAKLAKSQAYKNNKLTKKNKKNEEK